MYFNTRLWAMTQGVRLRMSWTVFVGLIAVTVGIARLALLGWLIGLVFQGATLQALLLPIALVIAVMVLRTGLEYYRALLAHDTAAVVQEQLRQSLYNKVAELGPAHFTQARTGAVALSMVEGVEQLEIYFGQYLPQLFVTVITPFLIFAFVAFLDLPIALVMLGFALFVLFAPALWHHKDSEYSLQHRRDYNSFASEFLDALQGLTTLKSFGQSGSKMRQLREKTDRLFRSTVKVMATNTLTRGITDMGIALATAVAVGWGAYRVVDGEMPLISLLIILMLGTEVFRPLRELRNLLHQGMVGLSAAQGIFDLLDAKTQVRDARQASFDADRLFPTVTFDQVSFAYPGGRQAAHKQISFDVSAGECVAVVGPSGSGKSTISRLLLRFYDPQQGAIKIGGHDLRELTFAQLHQQIALVAQDTYLFHGTVADNLRMGKSDASQKELEQAARDANAHEFISQLPEGYDTLVGERGLKLSGGQRQRIAIARAILRDAPILILDEALSAVDAENEATIQQALNRLMAGRTTLIFAHRLSSVIGADRILVLNQGELVETGIHNELMLQKGVYHQLMAGQTQDNQEYLEFNTDHSQPEPDRDGNTLVTVENIADNDSISREAEKLSTLQVVKILLGMVEDYRIQLVITFLLGIARVLAFIGVGVLSALMILAVKNGETFSGLLTALFIVAPLAGILHWLESWLAHNMAYKLLGDMRIDMFKKLDTLAPAYLLRRRSGDILGVVTHDIELIEYFFAHTIAPAFVAILVPAVVLTTLFYHSWLLALVLLPFLVYAALHPVLARSRIDQLGAKARAAAGDLNAHAVDSVQGLSEIIAYQQIKQRSSVFVAKTREFIKLRLPFLKDLAWQTSLQELATGLGGLTVVITGAWLVMQGQLDAGMLPLLTLLATAAFLPISEIAQVSRQFADTLAATRRVYAVHQEPASVRDGTGVEVMKNYPLSMDLAMEQVRFRYPDRQLPALEHVDLPINAGATVALVGPSGAGKTTIANLLLRFWDPDQGVIRLAGHDLRDYRLDDLRQHIALVAQDTYLFNDTLSNNILLAKPDADNEELQRAIDNAALAAFIDSLPEGLDTMVGERGTQLSGGQRQRVAIARAFLKDAPILILDEATSHLDAISEQAVRDALSDLMQGRTTIVIAHRLSTIRDADQIVVLQQGHVAEMGSHQSLLEQGGLYAQMVSRQIAGVAAPALKTATVT